MVKRGLKGGILEFLRKEDARDIHIATLETLERTGIHTDSDRILETFREAGANIDSKKKIVRIPEYLISEALRKAPKKIILCGRDPEHDFLLEGSRVYFGLGGTPVPYIRDLMDGENRRPEKSDVAECSRIGDALPNMYYLMTIAGAFDVPWEAEYLHELEAILNNTTKPVVFASPGADGAKRMLAMAATVTGGMEELRRRPIVCLYSEPASPLTLPKANENMIEFAKARVPITLGPMPMVGSTGPGTLVGTEVTANSENLAAITMVQLVNPGAPIIYAGWVCSMDPRSGICTYGAPEFTLGTGALNAAMAHYYDLPCFSFGGAASSNTPDAQAGAEIMMNGLIAALTGTNLVHDCGYLSNGMVGSIEMAVIANEVVGIIYRILKGINIDDDMLATEVLSEVGPGGHFLSHKHTFKYLLSEIYIPQLFDISSPESWVKAGKKEIREKAREQAKRILKEHEPTQLPRDVQKELSEIVKQGEKELTKKIQ